MAAYLLVQVITKRFDFCGCLHPEGNFALPFWHIRIVWVLGVRVALLHTPDISWQTPDKS